MPDILVLRKALGGGILPIAAVLTKPELNVAADYALGHYTHEKNTVTSQAALTTIDIIEDENLVEHVAELGDYALKCLNQLKTVHPVIGYVRGQGFLIVVKLIQEQKSKTPAPTLRKMSFTAVWTGDCRPRLPWVMY